MNFNGPAHLLFHQSSASPEWPETPRCAAKRIPLHRKRTPGSKASVFPPPAAKRHELQWTSSSAVPSKFSQPGVARDTHSAPKRNLLTAAHPRGAKSVFSRLRRPARSNPRHLATPPKRNPSPQRIQCLAAFGGQPAAHPRGAKRTRYLGTGNPSLGVPGVSRLRPNG